jgi:hypothetical protein
MADNVPYTPGSGADIAADDIGGVMHQRVKMQHGADGTATDTSDVSPMPVQEIGGATSLLSRILSALLSPLGYDKSLARQRSTAVIESGTLTTCSTVTTVTTVTTLAAATNLVNLGGIPADVLTRMQINSAWASTHRARIT